jgi:Ca-activated chloride channel family protein
VKTGTTDRGARAATGREAGPAVQRPARGDRAVVAALLVLIAGPVAAYLVWDLARAGEVSFKHPYALLLLAAAPLAFWTRIRLSAARSPHLSFSSTTLLGGLKRGVVSRLSGLPGVLRVVALALCAVALARPQTRDRGGRIEVEGIDIVVALDMSNSMEAIDLYPNRLEAAKRVLDEFISRRRSDRIGLVVFGKEAFTHCPLTLDYSALRTMLAELRINYIDGSATAIGNALGVSLARLRKSDAKSKVAILLTDGENNSGNVTPTQAARYARAMGVKVFTILMGAREGEVSAGRDIFGRPIQVQRQYPVNPKLLQEIARTTGGRSYLATDREALERNFENILDTLDKSTRRDVAAVFQDAFRPFAVLAVALLLLEILLGLTRMRRFP